MDQVAMSASFFTSEGTLAAIGFNQRNNRKQRQLSGILISILTAWLISSCDIENPSDIDSSIASLQKEDSLRAPGYSKLARAIDLTTISVSITVTLDDTPSSSFTLNATQLGNSNRWQTEPFDIPLGIPFTIEIVWSATGIDMSNVVYAQASRNFEGITVNTTLDLGSLEYNTDFDEDNDGLTNFIELVNKTPPTLPQNDEGNGQPSATSPGEFVASLTFPNIKTLRITWEQSSSASYYIVQRRLSSDSDYQNIIDNKTNNDRSFQTNVSLYEITSASYRVKACASDDNCTDSNQLEVGNSILDAIGYIKSSNPDSLDSFGHAVAISQTGRVLAVGANLEDSANEDQGNNSAQDAGAVYIFEPGQDHIWRQTAYIKAENADAGDKFGFSVSLSADGNTLAIGARDEDSAGSNPRDNSAVDAGAVYIYQRTGGAWQQQAYLKADNPGLEDWFGYSTAISADGNTLAVGARLEDSSGSGVNGVQNDRLSNSGAVYIFTREGQTWRQQAFIKSDNPDEGDLFGESVALSSDGVTLAIGAESEDGSSDGVNNTPNNSADGAGAVYIFTNSGSTTWIQQAYIKASNSGAADRFGRSVALSANGNTLAVGSTGEDSLSNAVNGGQGNSSGGESAGAAYIFFRTSGGWAQQAYIKPSAIDPGDLFGRSVSLSDDGNKLAVGAFFEDSLSDGLDLGTNDNSGEDAGAAYIFEREGQNWNQRTYIKASNPGSGDRFGRQLALSGDGKTLVVGAFRESSASQGVGGDQNNNSATSSGAAYLY